jgi:hypothetical protein
MNAQKAKSPMREHRAFTENFPCSGFRPRAEQGHIITPQGALDNQTLTASNDPGCSARPALDRLLMATPKLFNIMQPHLIEAQTAQTVLDRLARQARESELCSGQVFSDTRIGCFAAICRS